MAFYFDAIPNLYTFILLPINFVCTSGCKYGSEALVKASSHGHTKVARRLLQAGSHQDSADYVSSRLYDATLFLVLHSHFLETWLIYGIAALIKA